MKLLIAAITFAATLGMLFLIETGKSPKEDPAQIIEALKEENTSAVISTTPTPLKTSKQPSPSPQNSSKTPAPTQTLTPTLTPSHTPSRTPAPMPIPTRTPTPIKTPTPTPIPISPSPSPTPSETPTPIPTTTQIVSQNNIEVLLFTSPIERGKTENFQIKVPPASSCLLKYILPNDSVSKAQDLANPKTAGDDGIINWEWRIGSTTTLDPNNPDATIGYGKLEINCGQNGNDFSQNLQIVLEK